MNTELVRYSDPHCNWFENHRKNYLEDFNAKVVCHILSVSLDPNVERENDAVLDLVFQHHWRFHDVTLNDGTDFDSGKLQ